jgi:hypothetical protein
MNTLLHRRVLLGLGAGVVVAGAGAIIAQQAGGQPGHGMAPDHVMLAPADLQWTDAPPSLPPGAKIAVLEGDPASAGPFTFRIKVPAGYRIPAHFHPQIEHVTVISGAFNMGTGDKLDTTKGKALPPGGFAVMQIGTRHFAWADVETVVQVHGVGPWGITYVDPATDPRNKK